VSLGAFDYEQAMAEQGRRDVTIIHRTSTGSTNDDARALPEDRLPALVIAETQTKGRGRGSNRWLSPEGCIAFTLATAGVDGSSLGVLPLGVGARVANALRARGARALVKWPNDILIDGLKVSGILCESSLLAGSARVLIGVGVNVEAASDGPHALGTSLADHGITVDRPALVADIAVRVLDLIRGGLRGAAVVDSWKSLSVPWWGEEATFIDGESERRVTLLDVNPEGQLVVRDEHGVVRSLLSGEVRRMRTASA
jgi:BirA family biotin operon repressor/biotin-[acetyl-CoA-carboxylase] ligase